MPGSCRQIGKGTVAIREATELFKSSRSLLRRTGYRWSAPWQFPSGVYPPLTDQRGYLSRPGFIGPAQRSVALGSGRLGSRARSLHSHATVVVENNETGHEVLALEGDLHVEQRRSVEISFSDVHDRSQQALPTK